MKRYRPKIHRKPVGAQTRDKAYLTNLSERMPQMTALFEKLGRSEHPNFYDVMAAISEMVALYIDCDTETVQQVENIFLMSQKKCRFCD